MRFNQSFSVDVIKISNGVSFVSLCKILKMYSTTNQTPISILQEVGVRRSIKIYYELVANEGQAHEPIYVYQCRAGNVSAIGKGLVVYLSYVLTRNLDF